jgi:hypothetical protein
MIGATIAFGLDQPLGRGTLLMRTAITGVGGVAVLAAALLALTGRDLASSWRLLRGGPSRDLS